MVHTVNNAAPRKVAHYDTWVRLYFNVIDNNIIFIDSHKEGLVQTGPSGEQGGLPIAKTDNIVSLWWKGPLWIFGSAQNVVFNVTEVKGQPF